MKGSMGLAIAAGLGIVGAICNWLYLDRLAGEQQNKLLVAVKNNVQLNIGDTFTNSDLEPVPIPESRAGNLIERAVGWEVHDTVVGERATRVYSGGEIVLEEDLVTPATRDLADTLPDNQVARTVPIDPRSTVPELINPGDMVSFEVSRFAGPTPAGNSQPANSTLELIGPFQVLTIGERREPTPIAESVRGGSRGANTITIIVNLVNGQYEAKAVHLLEAIRGSDSVVVVLHSSRLGESSEGRGGS
jgi:Flp pilus assembly protein CpaB